MHRPEDTIGDPERTGITGRAIVVAMVLVVGFTVAGCFSVMLRYEIIGTGYLPRGAVALLLALIAVNGALRGAKRFGVRPLSAKELLLIFLLLMVVGAIAGQEFAQHFYLKLIGLTYYSTPDIAPPELFLHDLNPLLMPSVDPNGPVAQWAHEGLPPGRSIPWRAWVVPLAVWTPFFLAVYFMVLSFAATLAHRWEDEEKLLYPLVEVPVETVKGEPNMLSSLLRSPMMWIAFAIPCILYSMKGLHGYWPTIPYLELDTPLRTRFTGPMSAFNGTLLYVRLDMIGIAYLLSGEVGFSLWFFWLLRRLQQATRIAFGVTTAHSQFFTMQTIGGYLLLAVALLYSARDHLVKVVGVAIGAVKRKPGAADADEPYRLSVLGFIASFGFIVWWCSFFGMDTIWAVVQYLFFPLVGMVVARVICEAGMLIYSAPLGGYIAGYNEALFDLFGVERIGAKNVTMMSMTSLVQIRSTATQNMAAVFMGYKIGSQMGAPRQKIMLLSIVAIALAIIACHVTVPYIIYKWGIPKLADWPSSAGLNTTRGLARIIESPVTLGGEDYIGLGLGAVTTWALFALRRRFIWWPLHPLGFVTWMGWPIDRYWTSIFIGWVFKTSVTRLFGFRGFRRLKPLALGLVLGMNVVFTIWLIIHLIWPNPFPIMID
ncbi:MAG: DUF6785 family protein [Armatimonadota bacterium]